MRSSRTATASTMLSALLLATLLASCGKQADAPPRGGEPVASDGEPATTVAEATNIESVDSASLATARSAATTLGQGLMKELLARLNAEGPDSALAFCADSAQALTARYQRAGVDVRRTSLRVRNPSNSPDSADARILNYLGDRLSAGNLPTEFAEVRRSSNGTRELRYYRPITIVAGCLNCHGAVELMKPSIRAVLAERYPNDAAVGYREGELRGVVAVRVGLLSHE